MNFHVELSVAEEAAYAAGKVIAGLFEGTYDVREKGKGDPVTSADLEANAVIRAYIGRTFSDDGWLSEEDADDRRRLGAERVWIVDPLDGTREFIRGIPEFCVSIGLAVHGRSVLGVIYNPMSEELFAAAEGHGANLNGEPLLIEAEEDAEGGRLLVSRSEPRRKYEELASRFTLEAMGSIAYRMACVAVGRADATITFRRVKEWDVCGGTAILEAAGGLVIDGAGKRPVFNRVEPLIHRLIGGRAGFVRKVGEALG